MNGSCELFIYLKVPFCGDAKRKAVTANYGLAGHPWASACPAVSQEPALAPMPQLQSLP